MGGGLSSKAQQVEDLLRDKWMTRDQLAEQFRMDVDAVNEAIDKNDTNTLDRFIERLDLIPSQKMGQTKD